MLLVFVFFLVLIFSFSLVAYSTRQTELEKVIKHRVSDIQQARHEDKTRQEDAERILKIEATGPFAVLDQYFERYKLAASYRTLAVHADSHWSIGAFVSYSAISSFVAFLIVYIFARVFPLEIAVSILGLFLPYLWLKRKRAKRLGAFNDALPDAIDMMARALRAGHSISSAIEVLAEQAGEAVAVEFAAVFRQQNFGLPLRDALLQMAERVPSKDLSFLVTAMLVQKETGGNLIEILDRTTHVIRERLRIEGEVRTHTAQGRLTGWILSLLPIVMLVLLNLVSPGYSNVLLHDPLGQKLMYAGGIMICIGTFIIRKIVTINV